MLSLGIARDTRPLLQGDFIVRLFPGPKGLGYSLFTLRAIGKHKKMSKLYRTLQATPLQRTEGQYLR
jgi:hypothetical protein